MRANRESYQISIFTTLPLVQSLTSGLSGHRQVVESQASGRMRVFDIHVVLAGLDP